MTWSGTFDFSPILFQMNLKEYLTKYLKKYFKIFDSFKNESNFKMDVIFVEFSKEFVWKESLKLSTHPLPIMGYEFSDISVLVLLNVTN